MESKPLKFFCYSPMFGRSHTTYMGALADALVERGHEVVSHLLASTRGKVQLSFDLYWNAIVAAHLLLSCLQVLFAPLFTPSNGSHGTTRATVIEYPTCKVMKKAMQDAAKKVRLFVWISSPLISKQDAGQDSVHFSAPLCYYEFQPGGAPPPDFWQAKASIGSWEAFRPFKVMLVEQMKGMLFSRRSKSTMNSLCTTQNAFQFYFTSHFTSHTWNVN